MINWKQINRTLRIFILGSPALIVAVTAGANPNALGNQNM